MRSDLRKLFWRLRTGAIHRTALETAVEEACRHLVTRRHRDPPELLETSPYARPLLAQLEAAISAARALAPEGAYREAVQAVERAEAALDAARRIARAHASHDAAATEWRRLQGRFELSNRARLTTLRELEAALALAESFLRAGEARKAQFVADLCRDLLERLNAPDAGPEPQQRLRERLAAAERRATAPEPDLRRLLERMAGAGFSRLGERLMDDWETETPPEGDDRSMAAALARIGDAGREARALSAELSALEPPPVPESPSGSTPTNKEIETCPT